MALHVAFGAQGDTAMCARQSPPHEEMVMA